MKHVLWCGFGAVVGGIVGALIVGDTAPIVNGVSTALILVACEAMRPHGVRR